MNALPRPGAVTFAPDQRQFAAPALAPEQWRVEDYPVIDELVATGVIHKKFAHWAWDPALNAGNAAPRVMDVREELGEAVYIERYRQLSELGRRKGAYDLVQGQYGVLIPRVLAETQVGWNWNMIAKIPQAVGSAVLNMEGGSWRTTAEKVINDAGPRAETFAIYGSGAVPYDSLETLHTLAMYHGSKEYPRTTPRPARLPAGHLLPVMHESGAYPPYDYLFMPTLGQQQ